MAVFFYHGSWVAEVWNKGKKIYRQTGFKTKLEAQVAEKEAKEQASQTNTDFIKLCESRLEELELKRSAQHFKENRSLIQTWIRRWGTKRITRDDIEQYLNDIKREQQAQNEKIRLENSDRRKRKLPLLEEINEGAKPNKHLRLLRALFTHGINRGWIKDNPLKASNAFLSQKSDGTSRLKRT